MKILFLTIGSERTPSTRFRVKQYFTEFDKADISYRHVPIPHATLKRFSLVRQIRWSDVIFLQKKLFSLTEIAMLRSFNKPIIFDMDDVVFHEHPLYAQTRKGSRLIKRNKNRFQNTLQNASAIIVGNDFLQRKVKFYGFQSHLLPTPVDTDLYSPVLADRNEQQEKFVIGWIGTRRNLYYLEKIKKPLRQIVEQFPQIIIRVICDANVQLAGVPVDFVEWQSDTEIEDLRSFSIGIMPLTDDIYSQGKCGFKLLQYMSLGLATVSSPIGVNKEIINHGYDGFLAESPEEWLNCMIQLITSEETRRQMSGKARQKVIDSFSVSVLFPRLFHIITETCQQYSRSVKA